MKLYKIRDWDKLYENSQSRKVAKLAWVPIPNHQDGETYLRIMSHPKGSEIFTGFIILLEIASKCKVRGTLAKNDGTPHTPTSLGAKSRCPTSWLLAAFDFLENQTDWLEVQEVGSLTPRTLPERSQNAPSGAALNGIELNRIESTILVVGSSILGSNVDLNSSSPATVTGPSTRILKEFSPRPESESLAAIDSNNEEDAIRGMRDILGADVFEGTPERVADGGKWRENWREKRSKVVRVFAELVATGKLGHIQAPGALAAALWKEFQ